MYFTSIARDVVRTNHIDELFIKRSYNIDSSTYDIIIQQLKDAKIIDDFQNVLMSSDTLEHFFDIYKPNIFHCAHGIFDKDIFICLGEIILEHGFDYARSCFSSTDELLDYLKIMENLDILSFENGNYKILCSMNKFHDICKGVPEYYSNSKSVIFTQDDLALTNYDKLTGSEFEYFCSDILLRNGFQNVTITKGSGDHGVDILAEKDTVSYAIQCKCYSGNVGNSAIQEILSGKKLYRKDLAVVLTNQYFTSQAKEEAVALGVKLWDRDKLNEMIANLSSKQNI